MGAFFMPKYFINFEIFKQKTPDNHKAGVT